MNDERRERFHASVYSQRLSFAAVVFTVHQLVFHALFGIGLTFDPESFHQPVYEVAEELGPLWLWDLAFLLVAGSCIVTLITRRFVCSLITNTASILVMSTLFYSVLIAKFFRGATLSWGGIALWAFVLSTTLTGMFSRRQLRTTSTVTMVGVSDDRATPVTVATRNEHP